MSTKKTRVEEEVKKTMVYLDEGESLPPDPYFFTRLQQKLEEKHRSKITFETVLKPAFLTLIIIVNIGTAIWQYSEFEKAEAKERREKLAKVFLNQQETQNNNNLLGLN